MNLTFILNAIQVLEQSSEPSHSLLSSNLAVMMKMAPYTVLLLASLFMDKNSFASVGEENSIVSGHEQNLCFVVKVYVGYDF